VVERSAVDKWFEAGSIPSNEKPSAETERPPASFGKT